MAQFIPRVSFPSQLSLPRSYFLGHHAAGLSKMKTMLSSIDLIIECRDYRVPLTSRNPLFEQSLAGRERLIIYTKRDLGSKDRPSDKKVVAQFSNMLIDADLCPLCAERRYYPLLARTLDYSLHRFQIQERYDDCPKLREGMGLTLTNPPRYSYTCGWYAECRKILSAQCFTNDRRATTKSSSKCPTWYNEEDCKWSEDRGQG